MAKDGADGNSPFTKALAQTIKRPGLGIFDAFNEVGLAVMQVTGNTQQPWVFDVADQRPFLLRRRARLRSAACCRGAEHS